MKMTFYGAAREVTGSLALLESGGTRILVDCGMHQGGEGELADSARNRADFPFDPASVDAVFLTHGHMDHTGRLPLLAKRGFRGPVHCTEPTAEIARIIWRDIVTVARDAVRAAKKRGESVPGPMYDEDDVERAAELFRPVPYGKAVKIGGLEAVLHDAGHILGSSFIAFRGEGRTAVFSGDLGNEDMPLLRPTERLPACDALVIESTYGDRLHESAETRRTVLKESILEVARKRGTLLIPVFAVERTQEILLALHRLSEAGEIPRLPVFLDSPMAIDATKAYEEHPEFFREDAHREYVSGHRLFSLPGLVASRTREESKRINDASPPKVILSGSGMMSGGRIHHHLARVLPDPNSTLLIVGFQGEGTLGRKIAEGAREVVLLGEKAPVRCRVRKVDSWSAHADQGKLLRWVREAEAAPVHAFVTHGEESAALALAEKLRGMGIEAHVPHPGERVLLREEGVVFG